LKLSILIIAAAFLLFGEAILFYAIVHPSPIDDLKTARAFVEWNHSPSPKIESDWIHAMDNGQRKRAILVGCLLILFGGNAFAIYRLARKIRIESTSGQRGEGGKASI
jgi:hypothetical protein